MSGDIAMPVSAIEGQRRRTPVEHFRAQYGEDRILARELSEKRGGYYVEVGSYNGESYSNTYYFEKSLDWTGVLIEADPELVKKCVAVRPKSTTVNCAAVSPGSPNEITFEVVEGCQWVSSIHVTEAMRKRIEDIQTTIRKVTVPAKTLDVILEECDAPHEIDFITIDVEGHELGVLQGFTPSKWNPRTIILERNHHLPDPQIMRYMHANGFRWQRTTGCNDWFQAAAAGSSLTYRFRIFSLYYLPKYLTIWKPLLDGPVKRGVKGLLRKIGVLDAIRAMKKHKR
jgi:FkbM family methyltransferase